MQSNVIFRSCFTGICVINYSFEITNVTSAQARLEKSIALITSDVKERILIDGIDIQKISLYDLRSKLSIITVSK